MGLLKTIIGSIFYFGGIITVIWGAYTFISIRFGADTGVSFAGAIAGIGIVAIITGVISFFLGKLILR